MADQFDQAQHIDLLMTESARAHQEKKAASEPKLRADGTCHSPMCGEPLEAEGQLFCGPGCAEEHKRYGSK